MEALQLELPSSDAPCLELQCLIIGNWSSGTFSMMNKSDRVRDLQLRLKKLKFDHDLDVRVDGLYIYRARQTNKRRFSSTTTEWLKEANDIQQVKNGNKYFVPRWTREKLDPENTIGDAFPLSSPTASTCWCHRLKAFPSSERKTSSSCFRSNKPRGD